MVISPAMRISTLARGPETGIDFDVPCQTNCYNVRRLTISSLWSNCKSLAAMVVILVPGLGQDASELEFGAWEKGAVFPKI
jgi:hypothetical protein